jgi:hypothetical protein
MVTFTCTYGVLHVEALYDHSIYGMTWSELKLEHDDEITPIMYIMCMYASSYGQ